MRLSICAGTFAVLFLVPALAFCGVLALDFTTPTSDGTNATWSLGWEFNVLSPITVTMLGFYDDGKNGLSESHAVGIYDSLGSLLVSGTVVPADALTSWWRFTSVTPTLLPVGSDYRIAAVTGSENYTWDPVGFVVNPNITYVGSRYTSSGTLVYPSESEPVTGYFGPNFQFEGGVIPEPSTFVLLGAGLIALGMAARRRKSS